MSTTKKRGALPPVSAPSAAHFPFLAAGRALRAEVVPRGTSDPDAHEGDIILIDEADTTVRAGSMYAVDNCGILLPWTAFMEWASNRVHLRRDECTIGPLPYKEARVVGRVVVLCRRVP